MWKGDLKEGHIFEAVMREAREAWGRISLSFLSVKQFNRFLGDCSKRTVAIIWSSFIVI